ncbi:MAG: hypothetical protein NC483_00140 [Ruminococcus sp.]|nr:hypothetical protein [Ruminococcus sp.]
MEIRSKSQFIYLLIGAMTMTGDIVDNFDFEKDIFKVIDDRRFNDLFYFFRRRDDLDFTKELQELVAKDFIYCWVQEDNRIVIKLNNVMFQCEALKILKEYDEQIIQLMVLFLKEKSLSWSLSGALKEGTLCKHSLVNPNGVFRIDNDMRIISNGVMKEIDDGLVLVENASFTVIERLKNGIVCSFELLHPFDNGRYIHRIAKNISELDTPITYYEETYRPELVLERRKFQAINKDRIIKYDVL